MDPDTLKGCQRDKSGDKRQTRPPSCPHLPLGAPPGRLACLSRLPAAPLTASAPSQVLETAPACPQFCHLPPRTCVCGVCSPVYTGVQPRPGANHELLARNTGISSQILSDLSKIGVPAVDKSCQGGKNSRSFLGRCLASNWSLSHLFRRSLCCTLK